MKGSEKDFNIKLEIGLLTCRFIWMRELVPTQFNKLLKLKKRFRTENLSKEIESKFYELRIRKRTTHEVT